MATPVNEVNLLLEVFPYSIVLDASLRIKDMGSSILKIIPESKEQLFLQCFQIQRPYLEYVNFEVIYALTNEGFYIKHNESGFVFRGQFRHLSDSGSLMFLGSLWVMDIEQLKPYKLQVSDFPAYDPTFDYLHVLKQADIHKNELTDLIKKIDYQSAEIKKTNAELHMTKTQLENIFNEMTDVVYSIKLPEKEILFITPSVAMLCEVEAQAFLNDYNLWERFIKEEDKFVVKEIRNQLKEVGAFNVNFRIITPEGILKWVNNHGKFIYNDNQIPVRLDGVVSDRTQH